MGSRQLVDQEANQGATLPPEEILAILPRENRPTQLSNNNRAQCLNQPESNCNR